jgi:hypothetical protein
VLTKATLKKLNLKKWFAMITDHQSVINQAVVLVYKEQRVRTNVIKNHVPKIGGLISIKSSGQ